MVARVQCISVIDESNNSFPQTSFDNDWATFRTNHPDREFWLLQPQDPTNPNKDTFADLKIPAAFESDPLAYKRVVARDQGNVANRSDWFDICQLDTQPSGAVISVAIDTSGSMTLNTVQASYDLFISKCAAAGLTIILDTVFSDERWIPPHDIPIAPSVGFFILDGGNEVDEIDVIPGTTVTLGWIIFGDSNSAKIQPINYNIAQADFQNDSTRNVVVNETTTFTLTAFGSGGAPNTSRTVTVNVIPLPSITLSATLNPIVAGTCTTLQWDTDGTVDSVTWNAASGITNGNFTSSEVVCPLDTTTYTVTATATILGTVYTDVATVTIVVNQIPTINFFNVPEEVDYLTSPINIEYGFSYANVSVELAVSFLYQDSPSYVLDTTYDITPISGGAQIASPNVSRSGNIDTFITYNNQGPNFIQYVLTVNGSGGGVTENKITTVNIDRTPDNIIIPETDDKLKEEEPVYSPDVSPNDIIQSELLSIEGVDIPVEIKASRPIKVEVNQSGTFENVREI